MFAGARENDHADLGVIRRLDERRIEFFEHPPRLGVAVAWAIRRQTRDASESLIDDTFTGHATPPRFPEGSG